MLLKNSGIVVAVAINVDAAISWKKERKERRALVVPNNVKYLFRLTLEAFLNWLNELLLNAFKLGISIRSKIFFRFCMRFLGVCSCYGDMDTKG